VCRRLKDTQHRFLIDDPDPLSGPAASRVSGTVGTLVAAGSPPTAEVSIKAGGSEGDFFSVGDLGPAEDAIIMARS
jgi:hypothetical protein